MAARSLVLLAAALALAAPSAARAAGWSTFGFDVERTGFDPSETVLDAAVVPGLRQAWATDVGGIVDAQPSYARAVQLPGGSTADLVLVGTEQGAEIALDAATGDVVWRRDLGRDRTTCHDTPGGVYGISAPAVVDGGRVYVAGAGTRLHALDLATGAELPGWPVTLGANPASEHVWGGLNLSRGRISAGLASFCDNAFYRGSIVSVDVAPARRAGRVWLTSARVRGGGVWGWGGVAIDAGNGRVYAATANSQSRRQDAGLAEHVVRLSPGLRVEAADAPRVRRSGDADFGAHPVLFRAGACPPQLAVMHKSGALLLYDRDRIARGPRQTVQLGDPASLDAFSTYAWSPVDRALFVSVPSGPAPGVVALRVGSDCRFKRAWQTALGLPHDLHGAPIVGAGVLWASAGARLFALATADGRRLWDSGTSIGSLIAAAPVLGDGRIFVGAWDARVHAFVP